MSGEWTLYPEDGGAPLEFDSMISIEVKSGGKALTEPVEAGGFAMYNKVEDPLEISVSLARMGPPATVSAALDRLEELRRGLEKLTLSTPAATYGSLTLESFSYRRASDGGSWLLAVDCSLREVREVETNVTTESGLPPESCKSSSSASSSGGGKAGTAETGEQPKRRSMARDITGRGDG
jgi:hypothetical protein